MSYTVVSEVSFKADAAIMGALLQISVFEYEREGSYLFKLNETKLIPSECFQR